MEFIMKKKRTARQKAIIKRRIFLTTCALSLVGIIALSVFVISSLIPDNNDISSSSAPETSDSSEDKTPKLISSAEVISTGDIMVHSTQLDGAKTADGGYDFSAFFKETSKYYKKYDLAVANLEVTFGGTESGKFSGYPAFNSPDILADNIKKAGINLLLTTNNHSYDTGLFGLKRTVQILKERKIGFLGTKETESDPSFLVKDINGIKIGMASFSYETPGSDQNRKYLNGNVISADANNLINTFSYQHINDFYAEAENVIRDMKNQGAEFIVFYMHWGEEYQLSANTWQKSIAQKLSNLGVQMILGGHPHVIQPIDLIHSEDGQTDTICLYSMGNAVSNQRQEIMNPECTTGHTEDGLMFTYKLEKYSNGDIILSEIDVIPTWVDRYRGGSGYQYTIYPLENADDGSAKFGLTGTAATKSNASYNRTKALLKDGLTKCQQHIGCDITFKD